MNLPNFWYGSCSNGLLWENHTPYAGKILVWRNFDPFKAKIWPFLFKINIILIIYMPGKIWYSEFWLKTYRKLNLGRVLAGKLFFKSKWLLVLRSVVIRLYNLELVFWSLIFNLRLYNLIEASVMKHKVKWSFQARGGLGSKYSFECFWPYNIQMLL